ncbi:MAG: N-acetylmuramoyl-L-alanine amidase [Bacteroidales bacterium]|nr:N-acetylmuramoyl-L-alanine amidase [Bacteroidales bacterium]
MLILLDPAHGHNTPGKRSPDGTLIEAIYTRQLVKDLTLELEKHGHTVHILVPEPEDIPINVRVKRINAICRAEGIENTILISTHLNAAGDGSKWLDATGWSCYTCKGQTESDLLADCLYKAAEQILENQVIRTDYARDGDPDWEENFYILRHSLCPAVLTENFFMDSRLDLEYLHSKAGKQAVVDTHVEGIVEYLL